MLFRKVALVLVNWTPTSILTIRLVLVVRFLLVLIHSLNSVVAGFPGGRVRSPCRISDSRECSLFLSLNHFEGFGEEKNVY